MASLYGAVAVPLQGYSIYCNTSRCLLLFAIMWTLDRSVVHKTNTNSKTIDLLFLLEIWCAKA
jgi:hypothetical protein